MCIRDRLLTVLKAGDASTISVVKGIRQILPRVAQTLPPELKIQALSDQSIFVRGAIDGVIREGIIAATLTGLMILIFLGSWRSTLIIAISIPLSILTSVMVLSFLGETCLLYTSLLQFGLGFFGVHFTSINGSGPIGIGFSLIVVGIAALNLVLDFDFIENGVRMGAPKYMEWYGAFGLMVTLVWLYLEILRLLTKIRGRD